MTPSELGKFFSHLKKTRTIFGPKNSRDFGDKIFIDGINNFEDLYLGPQLPFYPFKRFFVPEEEALFEYRWGKLNSPQPPFEKGGEEFAVFGMNLLDLKSILLYDQVFEKDPYYQARRQKILILGHSIIPDVSQNIFEQTFEEDVLEHLSFDIFLGALKERQNSPLLPFEKGREEFAVFTGSEKGQKVLEEFGFEDYIHIQFSGPVREGKLDEGMLRIKDKLENHHNQKIWDELGRRCIECGKCTVACPTCFCFRIDDASSLEAGQGGRRRCWDSCYYQEFSEVAGPPRVDERGTRVEAGGHKFLNSTAARIHFWYFHKFGRIPDEFNFMGCVGCRRCAAVCPVGIDIAEILKEIENS